MILDSNIILSLCVGSVSYPAQIIKIESGSLWADILGYPKIIALIETVIVNAASFIYRTFTHEGRITSIPKKIEAVDGILQLRAKLNAEGIDTNLLDEKIKKSSIVIASELNKLLCGEPSIMVNDQTYSVGAKLENKFIAESKHIMIPEH